MMGFLQTEEHCMCWQLSALEVFLYGWQPEASTKTDKRKRKYGADQEPVSAELKTECRRYI